MVSLRPPPTDSSRGQRASAQCCYFILDQTKFGDTDFLELSLGAPISTKNSPEHSKMARIPAKIIYKYVLEALEHAVPEARASSRICSYTSYSLTLR